MVLKIEDERAEKLAQELARRTEEPVEEAIAVALERLDRVGQRQDRKPDLEAIHAIIARVGSLPDLDTRSSDEILGYNEAGLFD